MCISFIPFRDCVKCVTVYSIYGLFCTEYTKHKLTFSFSKSSFNFSTDDGLPVFGLDEMIGWMGFGVEDDELLDGGMGVGVVILALMDNSWADERDVNVEGLCDGV